MNRAILTTLALVAATLFAGCVEESGIESHEWDLTPLFSDMRPHADQTYQAYLSILFAIEDGDNESLKDGFALMYEEATAGWNILSDWRESMRDERGWPANWPDDIREDTSSAGNYFAVGADIGEFGPECRDDGWEGSDCNLFFEDLESFEEYREDYAEATLRWG